VSGRQSSMEQLLWSRWTQLSSPGSAAATCVGVSGGRCGVSGRQLSVSVVEAALVYFWILPSKLARWQDRICTKH